MFTFNLITENGTIEAGDKENAQLIGRILSCDFEIEMTDPKGGKWNFSGINAWGEVALIMGPNAA